MNDLFTGMDLPIPPQPTAADRAHEFTGQAAVIRDAMLKLGPATVSEIAAASGLDEPQVNKRLPQMRQERLVDLQRLGGELVLRPGKTGRLQRVWVLL